MKKRFLFFLMPIVVLLSFVACGNESEEEYDLSESGKEVGYSYVDLGLSVRWATYNVGASKLTEYGDYFSWGETSPKSYYYVTDYKWYKWDLPYHIMTMTKYNIDVDNKIQLDPEDDAAAANWKGKWRMPTSSELEELNVGCNWEWTDDMNGSGIAGRIGISKKNGKAIFLPAAGSCDYTYYESEGPSNPGTLIGYLPSDRSYHRNSEGEACLYWSSSLFADPLSTGCAYNLFFSCSGFVSVSRSGCSEGFSVRAVCPSENKPYRVEEK